MKEKGLPKISVITVCYNAEKTIEATIRSVLSQTYTNIEYIIIDGGSSDNTIKIIKEYLSQIAYFISESDKGVYDAMNKGIKAATGDWINFMNSGDSFYDDNVITKISKSLEPYLSVVYGDTNFIYEWGSAVMAPYPLDELEYNMIFSHQSSFVKTTLLVQNLFSIKYKIAGDYNLFYSLFKNGNKFKYVPITIANYDAVDGLSSQNHLLAIKENSLINHHKLSKWSIIKSYIYKIFPQRFIRQWQKMRLQQFIKKV